MEKTPTYAVIDCLGVGYLLNISLNTYSKIGESERCKLFTHLAIREDAHTLYGFAEEEERSVFRQLISVSGVGASTARMILSSMNPEEVVSAVQSANVGALKGVKGIGEKSAQRIIVDLKGKLGKDVSMPQSVFSSGNKIREEALTALVTLGFARNVSEKAVEKVYKAEGNVASVEFLIKQALKNL